MPDGIPKQSGLGQWKKSNNDRSLGELQLQFPFFAYWFRVIVQTNKPANHQPIAKTSVCTITLKCKTKKRVVAIATTPENGQDS